MATTMIMPRQGQSVESCLISKWHKKKGDSVKTGELLYSYETDKASFDEDAKADGILLEVFFQEGDDVPCLANVCVIGHPGEDTEAFRPGSSLPPEIAEKGNADLKKDTVDIQQAVAVEYRGDAEGAGAGPIKISPRAKNLAERSGIDYRYAQPSGPEGRIIERDIQELKKSDMAFTRAAAVEQMKGNKAPDGEGSGLGGRITVSDLTSGGKVEDAVVVSVRQLPYVDEVVPNIRRVIARTMHQSLSTSAQLTLNSSFDATEIYEFRKRIKENKDRLGLENITLNDIILYAVSRTLVQHRALNAHFLDDKIRYFSNVNLGVAIDTERGLMVPTVFEAENKSLNEISAEVKKLAKDCRAGTINPDLLKGGSFTVTNLGTFGIESFTPVLNPPQTGILGVNTVVSRARESESGIEFYPAMGLSLTFDHRALDGVPAAKFLQELAKNLENFSSLLVK